MSPNEHSNNRNKLIPKKSTSIRLGDLFRRRRNELDLSLESVERATHIRTKYLELIESGNYADLEDNVYSKGYVKNYAELLGFDTKEILRLYSQERHEYENSQGIKHTKDKKSGLKPIDSQTFTVTPKTFLVGLASLFVVIMVGYIGWQLSKLSAPPVINLSNQEKSTVSTAYVIVSGEVDSGSDVFINDSPILTSPDGSFSDKVLLADGLNQIKITARNKFNKEASKTIAVMANLGDLKQINSTDVRKTSFDGVELQISIGDQATYIIIRADNKEVFKGTMLPGTKQLFQAKESIKLTTGNAGSTNLRLTNAIVADKAIGSLGSEGETKQDIIFAKDTNVK